MLSCLAAYLSHDWPVDRLPYFLIRNTVHTNNSIRHTLFKRDLSAPLLYAAPEHHNSFEGADLAVARGAELR